MKPLLTRPLLGLWFGAALGLSACLLSPVEDLPSGRNSDGGSAGPPGSGGSLTGPDGDGPGDGGMGGEAGASHEPSGGGENADEAEEEGDAEGSG